MSFKREIREDGQFDLVFGAGINERDSFNSDPEECIEGQNFRLDGWSSVLKRRGTQDLAATTPNAGIVKGLLQMIDRDDVSTQLVAADSVIYKWDMSSSFSDVTPPLYSNSSKPRASHWPLDDTLVITDINLASPLFKWDGTSTSRLKTGLTIGTVETVSGATCAGSVATVVHTAHGFATGDLVTIEGFNETEYNGERQITVLDADSYTVPHTCSTTPATGIGTVDKGVDLRAKFSIVHDSRVWLFNVKADSTATPHMILVSAFENAELYDNDTRAGDAGFTGNEAFYILTPDLKGINGVAYFFSTIIVSTVNGKIFKITGTDSTDYAIVELYPNAGVLGNEAMVNIGNDILFFRTGKVIESLRSTDEFGDVAADDISQWIPTTIRTLDDPIAVYDSTEQLVYFFDATLKGVLVYDKKFSTSPKAVQRQLSPWTVFKTLMVNEWVTQAAAELRISGSSDRTVYWGDNAGNIYNINGTGTSGDGGTKNISVTRKSRKVLELDTMDELMIGRVEYTKIDEQTLTLVFSWLEEQHQETVQISLKPSSDVGAVSYWGGDIYWGGDYYFSGGGIVSAAEQTSTAGFSVPGKAPGFILNIQISTKGNYEISRIYV